MAAIFAGVMLWLFVTLAFAVHMELGSAATVILLSLGAVLVAISFIETIKVPASGFELKTREQSGVIRNILKVPRIDYLQILYWLVLISLVILMIMLTLIPTGFTNSRGDWQPINGNLIDYLHIVLVWNVIFALPAAIALVMRRRRRQRKGQEGPNSKEDFTKAPN